MHAEATSEKVALGWYLDGACSAVVGTHTHVQTADERVLPQGTAYITDVGMTGPHDSVIGVKKELIIRKFLTGIPSEFTVAGGTPSINAVVIETDDDTGKAVSIKRVVRCGDKARRTTEFVGTTFATEDTEN
jgi:calcineurin-like phosphoesterase